MRQKRRLNGVATAVRSSSAISKRGMAPCEVGEASGQKTWSIVSLVENRRIINE